MGLFGRKNVTGGEGASPPQSIDGRQWVIDLLAPTDRPGSMEQAHARGLQLFDDAYNAMKSEHGVRIEDITAMLGSVGGHLCLIAVLEQLAAAGLQPQQIGMTVLRGHDNNIYYFGDAPNWLLCEAPYSLISLLFGAAQQAGAPVSLELLHDELRLVAQHAGKPDFLELDLPADHQVDNPLSWARHFTPAVRNWVMGGMAPTVRLPIVVGFALQQVIDVGRQSLDPMTITRIGLQSAVRAAKLDPNRLAA